MVASGWVQFNSAAVNHDAFLFSFISFAKLVPSFVFFRSIRNHVYTHTSTAATPTSIFALATRAASSMSARSTRPREPLVLLHLPPARWFALRLNKFGESIMIGGSDMQLQTEGEKASYEKSNSNLNFFSQILNE